MEFLTVGGQLGHQSLKAVLLGAQSGLKNKTTPSGKKQAANNRHGKTQHNSSLKTKTKNNANVMLTPRMRSH